MPLFECTKCHAVDNTSLAENFWWDTTQEGKPALCSECDPQQGAWHGQFEKITAEEYLKRYPQDKIDFPAKAASAAPPCNRVHVRKGACTLQYGHTPPCVWSNPNV